MRLRLITPPPFEPLGLDEAKAHLRVDHADDDAYITGLIATARQYVEKHTGRQLIRAGYQLQLAAWPAEDEGGVRERRLPRAPLVTVDSVKYLDGDGVEQTLDADAYRATVNADAPGILEFDQDATLPDLPGGRRDAVRVNFTAGYGLRQDVPELLKTAMRLLVGEFYRRREASTDGAAVEIPIGIDRLLTLFTDWGAAL